jgi:palmitoyltransferase ZDHHC9/14/18
VVQMPKLGHTYILYTSRNMKRELMVGPHWTGLMYTATLTFGSTVAYLVQQCPTLPAYCTGIAIVMCAVTLSFLFMTGCTDPGIIRTDTGPPMEGHARWCDTCQVHQPPGAYHCDDCECCIEELDHHCPWMGKCIGKRNMFWFQGFNCCWVVYLIFVLLTTFTNASRFVRPDP